MFRAAKAAILPMVGPSLDLLHSYGFAEEDIDIMFEGATLAQRNSLTFELATKVYVLQVANPFQVNDDPEVIENSDPWSGSRVGPCIMEATGLTEIIGAWSVKALGSFAARRALLKAVGKALAKRAVPYLGAAIMVGEFVYCMGRE